MRDGIEGCQESPLMDLPWPLHFLKVWCGKRFQGIETPLLAGFKLTHRCNLRCLHCPFWRSRTGDMPFETVLETLEKIHAAGVRLVIFEGGEPLLWRDGDRAIGDVLAAAAGMFFSVGVTTNGTIPFLDLNADAVWVSIDGLKETNDAVRGPVFDRVMSNIAAAEGKNVLANVTINRLNCAEIPYLVRELAGRVRGVTIQFHYPYGKGEEDLSVSRSQRTGVLDSLISLKSDGYPVAVSYSCLEALKRNTWKCHDFLLANVEPDGIINRGCYVKNRGNVDCAKCGFAAHTEISLAFDLNPGSILAGWRIFKWKMRRSTRAIKYK